MTGPPTLSSVPTSSSSTTPSLSSSLPSTTPLSQPSSALPPSITTLPTSSTVLSSSSTPHLPPPLPIPPPLPQSAPLPSSHTSSKSNDLPSLATLINNLIADYAARGGSNAITMYSLRSRLANIIPFSFSIFPAVFSKVGCRANVIDAAAHCQTYPVGGPTPNPAIPIKNTCPYLYADNSTSTSTKHPLTPTSDDVFSPLKIKKVHCFQAPRPDLTPVAFSFRSLVFWYSFRVQRRY